MDEVGSNDIGDGDVTSDEEVAISKSLGKSSDFIWELSRSSSSCESSLVVWVEDSLENLVSDVSDDSDDLVDLGFLLG